MDDKSRRAVSRLAGRHPFKTLPSRLSRRAALTTVPALLAVPDPGNPMYVPLPRGTQARYAQLTVYSGTGADVCVGELRAYGP